MMILLLFALFLLCVFVDTPIAFGMGIATVATMIIQGEDQFITVLSKAFTGANSSGFLAIPLFMLAGSVMENGGISKRIVKFASGVVGHKTGGIAQVAVLVSMIFAGVSGSAVADTVAVGSIMMPAMNEKHYDKGFAAGIQACAGTLGPIIPPSLNMIIVASITGVSVGSLFLAGIVPGIMLGLMLMFCAYIYAKRNNIPKEPKIPRSEMWKALKQSFWALLMPVIILGGVLSGYFTATESGMIAVVYGLIVGTFVYRELTWKRLMDAIRSSSLAAAQIVFIAATANMMAWELTRMNFGTIVANTIASMTSNSTVFLLMMVVLFFVVGCFVEINAAILIFVPVLYPIACTYGVGFEFLIIFLLMMAVGQITPPVGVLLFTTVSMQKIEVKTTFRYLPLLIAGMITVVLILIFIPQIITFLPNLLGA